jgi:prepilin-type N-terminal cleavage/methylation domain-containing protein
VRIFRKGQKGSGLQTAASSQGFTIIEVLIVLAIAGLILLVVFLAVPALQRNSRNTQYRTEASRILAGAQEFMNNNGGTLPTNSDATTILDNANSKSITSLTVVNPGTAVAVTPTLTAATLETGVKCPTTVSGTSVTPVTASAPARGLILVYGIEKNDGTILAQCIRT